MPSIKLAHIPSIPIQNDGQIIITTIQYLYNTFNKVLKNNFYLHYNKHILSPWLIKIYSTKHLRSLTFNDRNLIKITTLEIRCEQGTTASLKSHAYVPANNSKRIQNNFDLCTPQRHTLPLNLTQVPTKKKAKNSLTFNDRKHIKM